MPGNAVPSTPVRDGDRIVRAAAGTADAERDTDGTPAGSSSA